MSASRIPGHWDFRNAPKVNGVALGTGGGTVPGADTHVLFNDDGAIGADSGLIYDKTTGFLSTKLAAITGLVSPVDASSYPVTLAGAGAGNVSNGTHRYVFTYTDGVNETAGGLPTAAVTVVDNGSDGKVRLEPTIYGYATQINVYRDKDSDGVYKRCTNVNTDVPFVFIDNTADEDLSDVAPTTATLLPHLSLADGVLRSLSNVLLLRPDLTLTVVDSPAGGGGLSIKAGSAPDYAGTMTISGGDSYATGGDLNLVGGQGFTGGAGEVNITGGHGATVGGNVRLTPGGAGEGGEGGQILIYGAGGTGPFITFDKDGHMISTTPITASAGVILPTSDPHIVGAAWNNAGAFAVSAG